MPAEDDDDDSDAEEAAENAKEPFYRENGNWPYVHSLVPLSLIALQVIPSVHTTIILLGALLALYAWESFEALLGFFGNTYLAETVYDSLLGDVVVGGLAVTNFWLIDLITGWRRDINLVTPYWLRLVAFVVIAAPSLAMGKFRKEKHCRFRYAVLVYGAFYVLIVALLFYISASVARAEHAELAQHIVWRTSLIIAIVVANTAIASIIEPISSTFLQIVTFEFAVFMVLMLILAIQLADPTRE